MKIITLHNPGSIYGREDEDDDDEDDDGCISWAVYFKIE